jgi:hypothetical protein
MVSTSTFSGVFNQATTGKPKKNITYKGRVVSKNGKFTFDVETNINGVSKKISKKDKTMADLRMDPEILYFMASLRGGQRKTKTKRR